ncbi:MAG: YaiO family outer membrane beta-barrel protein [Bacteroidota bacterium]
MLLSPVIIRSAGIAILLTLAQLTFAQTDTLSMGSDDLFKIARDEAFNGNREKARTYLKTILVKSPGYDDVRIFLGRTYAWDGRRNEARKELEQVLKNSPDNTEALTALIDVETWDDQHNKALELSNGGLAKKPTNTDLLYRKARAEHNLNNDEASAKTLQQLFAIDPNHKEGLDLMTTLKVAGIKNSLTVNYAVDRFARVFDAAQYAYLQYGRRTSLGSFFLRYNYAERFGTSGHQYEIDAYPTIAKGLYAYLNYGYSGTSLFTQNRFGGELYFKLPRSFEGSAGLRYLYFRSGTAVTLYTATVGKYAGNYWFSARTFLTPDKLAGLSHSYIFQVRRYFKDAENYVTLIGGFGFSPDVTNISQVTENTGVQANIANLKSQRIGLNYAKTFGPHWQATATVNYARQAYLFDPENLITIYSWAVGIQYRF